MICVLFYAWYIDYIHHIRRSRRNGHRTRHQSHVAVSDCKSADGDRGEFDRGNAVGRGADMGACFNHLLP